MSILNKILLFGGAVIGTLKAKEIYNGYETARSVLETEKNPSRETIAQAERKTKEFVREGFEKKQCTTRFFKDNNYIVTCIADKANNDNSDSIKKIASCIKLNDTEIQGSSELRIKRL